MNRVQFVLASLGASVASFSFPRLSAAAEDESGSGGTIAVDAPNLFPESFAYSATTKLFYVGSVRYGRVSSVDSSGTIKTLSDDPRLKSTFGIFVDDSRGLVHACNTDVGISVRSKPSNVGHVCELVSIDARSGTVVRFVDLIGSGPGRHLPNDGAVASDGTIYVTDTTSPVVYRVSKAGLAERYVTHPGFAAAGTAPGLDGIAIAASGTIVVNHISHGTFFRIDPHAKKVSKIALAGAAELVGCDGMRFEKDGRLIVAQSTVTGAGRNALNELTSDDDWKTATVSKSVRLSATTYQSVRTPAGVYGVQSRLEQLFKNPKSPHVAAFDIVRIAS